jgi:hypothetical protein
MLVPVQYYKPLHKAYDKYVNIKIQLINQPHTHIKIKN